MSSVLLPMLGTSAGSFFYISGWFLLVYVGADFLPSALTLSAFTVAFLSCSDELIRKASVLHFSLSLWKDLALAFLVL